MSDAEVQRIPSIVWIIVSCIMDQQFLRSADHLIDKALWQRAAKIGRITSTAQAEQGKAAWPGNLTDNVKKNIFCTA